jgi:hypothetical protein
MNHQAPLTRNRHLSAEGDQRGIVGYALLGGRNEQGAFFWTDAVAFVATPKRPGRR